MSILDSIFDLGTKIIKPVDDLIDNLHTSQEEKDAAKVEIEKIVSERISEAEATARAELAAKQAIIVAEMQQGDKFTKRARPWLLYSGMIMTAINYVLVPIVQQFAGMDIKPFELPTQFWMAWGGASTAWIVGRSAERRGVKNKLTSLITGGNPLDLIK
jgi:hypothetical protein